MSCCMQQQASPTALPHAAALPAGYQRYLIGVGAARRDDYMHLKRRCLQPSQTGLYIRHGECSKPNSTKLVKCNGTALPLVGARLYPAHNTDLFHQLTQCCASYKGRQTLTIHCHLF